MLEAVTTAVRSELDHVGDGEGLRRALGVADVVLHRAVLEDLRGARRSDSGDRLRSLLDAVGLTCDGDAFVTVEARAPELGTRLPHVLRSGVLAALTAVELPELGRASTPDLEVRAAAAMDSLGGVEPARLSAEAVASYLSSCAPVSHRAPVLDVSQLSGGFSKTTLLVALDEPRRHIVIRQVPPGRDATGLAAEYDVVRFAWEHGVPAPEPLWLEPRSNELGGPFFASARVAGANLGDVFGPRAGTAPEAAIGLAEALARLHSLDVSDVPATPVPPMSTRRDILEAVQQQADQVAAAARVDGDDAHPLHALLFAWLREHVPGDVVRPVLLHGDPGFHNMLFEDGDVRALLDWERSRVGDAAQDLAYVRPHVSMVVPWADFLDAYRRAGGSEPDEERLRWYAAWHDAWRYAGAYRGRARLLTGPPRLLDAVIGLLHAPRFLLSGLRTAYEVDL